MNNLINDSRSVADIVNDALEANPQIKQSVVAEVSGFAKPNMIYMIKTGKTKVPLDKAGKLAEAIRLDPREFWFKCLKEYLPGAFEEFENHCKQPVISATELRFIRAARHHKLDLMKLLNDNTAPVKLTEEQTTDE